jgi:hypothetical protein
VNAEANYPVCFLLGVLQVSFEKLLIGGQTFLTKFKQCLYLLMTSTLRILEQTLFDRLHLLISL